MPKVELLNKLSETFYKICKLEMVVGVLGITEVKIQNPSTQRGNYVSHEDEYKVQIQGKNIVAGYYSKDNKLYM